MKNNIRIKAMLLIIDNGRLLAGKGHDNVKNEDFYRLLGGSLNFNETSEQGIRREIKEELNSDIENLKLLDVIENIFTYNGNFGHEITFLFKGKLLNQKINQKEIIHIMEDNYEFDAYWIDQKDVLTHKVQLYPEYDYSKIL